MCRKLELMALGLLLVNVACYAQDNPGAPPAEAVVPPSEASSPPPEAAHEGASSDSPGSSGSSGGGGGWFSDMDVTFGGYIRQETAIKTNNKENPYNQRGNPYDSISVLRTPYLPPNSANVVAGNLVNPIVQSLVGQGFQLGSLPTPTAVRSKRDGRGAAPCRSEPSTQEVKASATTPPARLLRGQVLPDAPWRASLRPQAKRTPGRLSWMT